MEENLNSIFLAEAGELMSSLEQGLMNLEQDPANAESINNVFRVMHTLKGSAGMFGYDAVTELTHELETIYDNIRNGEKELNSEILQTTFECVDHLKHLFNDPRLEEPVGLQRQSRLLVDINTLLKTPTAKLQISNDEKAQDSSAAWYYILFQPKENILKNGTNTLYLIEDLLNLGTGISLPYFANPPALEHVEPQHHYLGFEVLLQTTKPKTEILDVFMFVESECMLEVKTIVGFSDELTENIRDGIAKSAGVNKPIGLEAITKLLVPSLKVEESGKGLPQRAPVGHGNIRVASERIDELMNLVSEMVTTQARLSLYSGHSHSSELVTISENVEKITRRLRDNAFNMSLIPIESLVVRFQRLVRDLSKELNKDIVFKTEGTETEVDKSIVEKLTDPILHILRNSLDHGIESAEERLKRGKPKQGTLLLKAYHAGANVVIEISDDGAGINLQKVKQKAILKGLIAADANLTEKELINLIFAPGFSTADQISGVSGRGVGMDVVKRNITDIRGDIDVTTNEGLGTTFKIRLPLTLSIIDGLLVQIGNTDFILPLSSVDKCYEVETTKLESSHNKWVTLDEQRTPFIYLRENFNIHHDAPEQSQVIKVGYNNFKVGLVVDRIVGEYQAVLKPLGKFYKSQDEFSGATILGDGSVALVLDPVQLIKKFEQSSPLSLSAQEK